MTDLPLTERTTPALLEMAKQAARQVLILEAGEDGQLKPEKKAAIAHHQAVKWDCHAELRRRGEMPEFVPVSVEVQIAEHQLDLARHEAALRYWLGQQANGNPDAKLLIQTQRLYVEHDIKMLRVLYKRLAEARALQADAATGKAA